MPILEPLEPGTEQTPKELKPFVFHRLDLEWKKGESHAKADCIYCGKDKKCGIEISTSRFKCWSCNETGNSKVFIEDLWDLSDQETTNYDSLAEDRRVDPIALMDWGAVRSITDGCWLMPSYNSEKTIAQLYRWANNTLYATPGFQHGIFGANLYDDKKPIVYLCEGPWDGIALYHALKTTKLDDHPDATRQGNFIPTAGGHNLLQHANVLATPGANVFQDAWLKFFRGKQVFILFDNDHPKQHPKTGVDLPPVGYEGVKRITPKIAQVASSVEYIAWGPGGYDAELPTGFDVRDYLSSDMGSNPSERLESLLGRLASPDLAWEDMVADDLVENSLALTPTNNYADVVLAWRKAFKWTEGLDHGLTVMLASITSTMSVGDQLWIKVIGPASCGKSSLCEAVSTSPYILAKSTIRGFHSGFGDANKDEDNSLVAQVAGKTLVTKDGDTLLQSPNLGQILAEGRDLYDSVSRTHYRNKMSKDYSGIRMTWILCGTSSLRSIDSSELGERFLDCVVMDGIDDDLEDEILWRVANRAERDLNVESDGTPETHQSPEMTRVMQLTGGYVNYLRENASDLLPKVEMSPESKRYCTFLGKFVAFMRARPSEIQDEKSEREFAARLVSQHIRLAKCLAVVLNKTEVDTEVLNRTRRVAFDTARGMTLTIAKALRSSDMGLETAGVAFAIVRGEDKARTLLEFLKEIGVVEAFIPGAQQARRWRLTDRLEGLFFRLEHPYETTS